MATTEELLARVINVTDIDARALLGSLVILAPEALEKALANLAVWKEERAGRASTPA